MPDEIKNARAPDPKEQTRNSKHEILNLGFRASDLGFPRRGMEWSIWENLKLGMMK